MPAAVAAYAMSNTALIQRRQRSRRARSLQSEKVMMFREIWPGKSIV
jgi:hypothetical protein